MLMPVLQDDLQQAANLLAAYGTKFDIGAAQINSPLNERLTMNLIRQKTLPGDRVLCVPRASHPRPFLSICTPCASQCCAP